MDARPGEPAPDCTPWHNGSAVAFTREAIRALDRAASDEFGIPSIVLMENAAIRIAEFAAGLLRARNSATVLVLAGPGNNGGDGLAAARQLVNAGFAVGMILAGAGGSGDAGVNLGIARKMGIPEFDGRDAGALDAAVQRLGPVGVIVDALLGTGAREAPREPIRTLIEQANSLGRSGIPILSIDIPSGLDADTGRPAGGTLAIRADWTVTLVGPKRGFASPGASAFLGRIVVADIGAPAALANRLGEPQAGGRAPA